MITYRNVSKKYSEFNLKIDSLDLVENNVHALLGENGAGKTTTIRMTLGLLKPTSGEILFDGRDVFRDASVKQKIGYVPDVPNLYESLTGYEQVNFIANLYKCSNDNYIRELMQKFNIFEEKDQVISSYSKGMKQKISIICALVHKPEILILDEPFTA
ncbi:MAG: ABC transporter ATP-binding protein, partial [Acutalibacteraceae bacterium]|nr:ABC transporter ATP-binding protein [Acutalibacteraceae bacterium]